MIRVLDAHALMAFLEKEPGYDKVKSLFIEAVEEGNSLLMTSVNFGEVYYMTLRECGQQKADEIERIIETLPLEIVEVGIPIVREAARFKAVKRISYADCFAAALAKLNDGEVVTGDREFRALESEIKILWIP